MSKIEEQSNMEYADQLHKCNLLIVDTEESIEANEGSTSVGLGNDALGLVLSPHYKRKT